MSQIALTKVQRRQVDAAAEVLRPWGLPYTLSKTGKHLKMKVVAPRGGSHSLTIAGSPRDDDNALKMVRSEAQRLVRRINKAMGL